MKAETQMESNVSSGCPQKRRKPRLVDVHVGGRVRLRRLALAMTREDLGGKLGVTQQRVQKYESGANRISASSLFEASQVLGVPVAFFFEGVDGSQEAIQQERPVLDFLSSQDGRELAQAVLRLRDKAAQRLVINLAEVLSSMPSLN